MPLSHASAGNAVLSSPCEGASSSLETTAKKKCAALLAGLPLTNPNLCVAGSMALSALCGCSAVLPLLGAVAIRVKSSPAAVFVCSGWSGPANDEAVMLAALAKAGFKKGKDGTWAK